jgi:hypothetical protein
MTDLRKLEQLADSGEPLVRWPPLDIEAYGRSCDHMGFILHLMPATGPAPEYYGGLCQTAGFSEPCAVLLVRCLTQGHRQVVLGSHIAPTPGLPTLAWRVSELVRKPAVP